MKTWSQVKIIKTLRKLVKARKGAVRTQGYESDESVGQDSDDEQDDALNDKQENLAEDDMFGESFETKTKKPKVLQEIEGQEWNADAQDYTEDGVKVEPFNMDQEMEEGYGSKQKSLTSSGTLMKQAIIFAKRMKTSYTTSGCTA